LKYTFVTDFLWRRIEGIKQINNLKINKMKKKLFTAIAMLVSITCLNAQQTDEKWSLLEQGIVSAMKMRMQINSDVRSGVEEICTFWGIDEECYLSSYAGAVVKLVQEHNIRTDDFSAALKFYYEVQDVNSIYHNELMFHFISLLIENCGLKPDILLVEVIGSSPSESVRMLNQRVLITIGTSSKYYVIDSDSYICVISRSYARELQEMGYIKETDFRNNTYLTLADGSSTQARQILINGIKLGDYTLNNVLFEVVEDSNITFLLGSNVLNAFKSATINNSTSTLELVK
jgi:hypothetical protein